MSLCVYGTSQVTSQYARNLYMIFYKQSRFIQTLFNTHYIDKVGCVVYMHSTAVAIHSLFIYIKISNF